MMWFLCYIVMIFIVFLIRVLVLKYQIRRYDEFTLIYYDDYMSFNEVLPAKFLEKDMFYGMFVASLIWPFYILGIIVFIVCLVVKAFIEWLIGEKE